jgi:hypothetical protein
LMGSLDTKQISSKVSSVPTWTRVATASLGLTNHDAGTRAFHASGLGYVRPVAPSTP